MGLPEAVICGCIRELEAQGPDEWIGSDEAESE